MLHVCLNTENIGKLRFHKYIISTSVKEYSGPDPCMCQCQTDLYLYLMTNASLLSIGSQNIVLLC